VIPHLHYSGLKPTLSIKAAGARESERVSRMQNH
jgi:hypothetical protein